MHISAFIRDRVRDGWLVERQVHALHDDDATRELDYLALQALTALDEISDAHYEERRLCMECATRWPCITVRLAAATWRQHPDYDQSWGPMLDTRTENRGDAANQVLARAMKIWPQEVVAEAWMVGFSPYLDGARPIDVLNSRGPAEVLEVLDFIDKLTSNEQVLPTRLPLSLPAVIESLPTDMSHSEIVALLNASVEALNDLTPIEWLTDGGAGIMVIDALVTPLDAIYDQLSQAMPLEFTSDWLITPNNYLHGTRPLDVLRQRGPAEVLAALDAELERPK